MPGNGTGRFVVSPGTRGGSATSSRRRRELLIYDPQVTDDAMLRMITERIKAGVEVKIIGTVEAKWNVKHERYPGKRLHTRAMIGAGGRAFVGSQSLRRLELEKRREIGVIITDEKVIGEMKAVFEHDWAQTESGRKERKKEKKAERKEERQLAKAS